MSAIDGVGEHGDSLPPAWVCVCSTRRVRRCCRGHGCLITADAVDDDRAACWCDCWCKREALGLL